MDGLLYGSGSKLRSEDEADRVLFVRDVQSGAGQPENPAGGVTCSGHWPELSDPGMREFMNVKTVRVGESADGTS